MNIEMRKDLSGGMHLNYIQTRFTHLCYLFLYKVTWKRNENTLIQIAALGHTDLQANFTWPYILLQIFIAKLHWAVQIFITWRDRYSFIVDKFHLTIKITGLEGFRVRERVRDKIPILQCWKDCMSPDEILGSFHVQ